MVSSDPADSPTQRGATCWKNDRRVGRHPQITMRLVSAESKIADLLTAMVKSELDNIAGSNARRREDVASVLDQALASKRASLKDRTVLTAVQ